jgi:acylphosphatase
MIDSRSHDPDTLTMTLNVTGVVDNVGFEEFATHYARRLSLVGRYESLGGGLLRITLFGRSELIEMFEMACLLGPRRSSVDKVELAFGPGTNCAFKDFEIVSAGGANGDSARSAKLYSRT